MLARRIISIFIDHFIVSLLAVIFWRLTLLIVKDDNDLFFWFALGVYFNKDIFKTNSIGKSIMGFRVVEAKSNSEANGLKCLMRNLSIIIWPIEVVLLLVNNERRLGDYIAGTKVIPVDKLGVLNVFAVLRLRVNVIEALFSLVLTVVYLIILGLILPL